jgi:hypothetical protein
MQIKQLASAAGVDWDATLTRLRVSLLKYPWPRRLGCQSFNCWPRGRVDINVFLAPDQCEPGVTTILSESSTRDSGDHLATVTSSSLGPNVDHLRSLDRCFHVM